MLRKHVSSLSHEHECEHVAHALPYAPYFSRKLEMDHVFVCVCHISPVFCVRNLDIDECCRCRSMQMEQFLDSIANLTFQTDQVQEIDTTPARLSRRNGILLGMWRCPLLETRCNCLDDFFDMCHGWCRLSGEVLFQSGRHWLQGIFHMQRLNCWLALWESHIRFPM